MGYIRRARKRARESSQEDNEWDLQSTDFTTADRSYAQVPATDDTDINGLASSSKKQRTDEVPGSNIQGTDGCVLSFTSTCKLSTKLLNALTEDGAQLMPLTLEAKLNDLLDETSWLSKRAEILSARRDRRLRGGMICIKLSTFTSDCRTLTTPYGSKAPPRYEGSDQKRERLAAEIALGGVVHVEPGPARATYISKGG